MRQRRNLRARLKRGAPSFQRDNFKKIRRLFFIGDET